MQSLRSYVSGQIKYGRKNYGITTDRMRSIVTWSQEPPLDNNSITDYYERAGSIVLLESSCYNSQLGTPFSSWSEHFRNYFPTNGIHTENMDLFSFHHKQNDTTCTIPDILHEMTKDLMFQNSSCVLVARGAMPSLVAQFYLESFPLAGLVMIDPCIVPKDDKSLQTTACKYMSSLSSQKFSQNETNLMNTLKCAKYSRTLKLEKGAVPMLIMYSTFGNQDTQLPSVSEDYFLTAKEGANETSIYHANGSDEMDSSASTPILLEQIPMNTLKTMEKIFSFYDDVF